MVGGSLSLILPLSLSFSLSLSGPFQSGLKKCIPAPSGIYVCQFDLVLYVLVRWLVDSKPNNLKHIFGSVTD